MSCSPLDHPNRFIAINQSVCQGMPLNDCNGLMQIYLTIVNDRSRCWTNYLPHYSASFLLDSIIVGDHDGWSLVMKDQGYDPKWGYLDKRPAYDVSRILTFAYDL